MIVSTKGKLIRAVIVGATSKGFPESIFRRAQRKIAQIDAAMSLSDLMTPPGNRLEALKGDRNGQHSIRIDDQWRICFNWDGEAQEASNVEIVDYH